MNDSGHLVVIEWDGMKPPTAFYHRVRRLTSGVRQDDSADARKVSPFARRAERNETAVIMQEGAIYCTSKSLARALALLAEQYGASNVELATVSSMAQVVATAEDIESLSKINRILGRRGRPPVRRRRNVTVTCFEEIKSTTKNTKDDIVNCPSCGSLSIALTYPGLDSEDRRVAFGQSRNDTLFEQWLYTRTRQRGGITFPSLMFIQSTNMLFLPKPFAKHGRMSGHNATIQDVVPMIPTTQRQIIEVMEFSDLDFLDDLGDHPDIVVHILDAIFVGRLTLSEEERLEGRLTALSSVLVRYPEIASDYMLALDNDSVDFFDASPIIPIREMVDYFTAFYVKQPKLIEEPESMPF